MREGGQFSPLHLPTDSVQPDYSSKLSWLGGTGGADIFLKILSRWSGLVVGGRIDLCF